MSDNRQRRVDRAQMRVLFKVPFFAAGVAKLPIVFDDTVKTACTDGTNIRWNGPWFDQLTDDNLVTVICHEVCHCMLGHAWRAPETAKTDQDSWGLWNESCDHAVNLMLKEFSAQVMAKRLADPFPFPQPETDYCADPQYKNLPEEVIFSRMINRPKQPGGKPGNKPGKGGGQGRGRPQFGEFSQPGKPNGKPGKGGGQPGQGQGKGGASPQPGQAPVPDQKKLQADWEGTFVNAVKLAKGSAPGSVARQADEMINPKVSWQELLRSWLREQACDDWDFFVPALEMSDCDFILPSLHSEKVGKIVFATDTSGSITEHVLSAFQTEKQACLDELHPECVVDIYCDSRIQAVKEYGKGETIDRRAPGGGGTSFKPVFEHIEKMAERPKALVYLTDLEGDFPVNPPPYPVIWVVWGETSAKAPFGETVYAREY